MSDNKLAVVILAAGQGTRMKSDRAKVLHELGGRPLVSYPVELAEKLRAEPIVVVVGHRAAEVERAVRARSGDRIRFAQQKEQKGTGHAVMQALGALAGFDGRVLVLSGDVPFLSLETARAALGLARKRSRAVVLVSMLPKDPTGYGRIRRDEAGEVLGIVEHKDATEEERRLHEVNAGIYVFEAAFLRSALQILKNDNAQGEYYLTDLVQGARAAGLGVGAVVAADPIEVEGVNHRVQLAELERHQRARILYELMLSGVTVIDPATTYVSRDSKIERDTVLEPGVHIKGATRIGAGCHVSVGSVLEDATLAAGVTVLPYSLIEKAKVRSGARIGPFARLRPETEVFEDAHVGNFVELKKTKLGRGAKANHLAYVGDAKVGAGTNIGAGTITCNYDGFGKYLTDLGEGVFVGSNATLVAPLKVGKAAYVAAGSTVTENVPADALVFGRAKQVVKKGRASILRQEAKKKAEASKKKK